MRTVSSLLILFAAIAGPAAAQEVAAGWLRKPSAEDLIAVWPRDALRKGQGGRAEIDCVSTPQGALRDCRVATETPAGSGFGAAALILSSQFLMKPAMKDGEPVSSTVRIPIGFPRPSSPALPVRSTPVVSGVPWLEAPTVADVLAAFPAQARLAKITGHATLNCLVGKTGRLERCGVPVQEPTGRGFDKAARILAERFLAPTEVGGKSLVGVRTQVPILFTAESLDASPVIGKPRWMAVPKLADLQAVLPPAAQKAGVLHARVVLRCRVAAGGAVDDCKVASETPAGLGYGAATLALAPTFRISVWSQEGLPTVGGVLDIPVRYDLAALRPSAAAAKP